MKRNLKKLLSIVMVVAMLFSLGTAAFATSYPEEGETIEPGLSGIQPGDDLTLPENTVWATLTASWGVRVTFKDDPEMVEDGEDTVMSVLVPVADDASGNTLAPKNPAHEGYTFTGWVRVDETAGTATLTGRNVTGIQGPGPIVYQAQYVARSVGPYSITVTNATPDHEYAAYKIFDATIDGDAIVYTYDGELPENDYFVQDENGYVTATSDATDSETGMLTTGAIEFLKTLVDTDADPDASETATGDVVELSLEEPGYYYITSTLGTVVTVDSARPDVPVIDKNQKPSWDNKVIVLDDGTEVTSNTANYGDVVNFDIGINATNFDGTEMITYYYITDTLDPGLTLKANTVKVTVGDADPIAAYEVEADAAAGTIDVQLKWAEVASDVLDSIYPSPCEIHITYSAVVNTEAKIGTTGNLNTAYFTYDTTEDYDPEDPPEEDPDPTEEPEYPDDPRKTTTYVYAIGLTKVDEKHDPLAGAQFELVDEDMTTIFLSGAYGEYSYDAEGLETVLDCDGDGLLLIKGLAAGTYYLIETKAPEGYNINTNPIEFVIDEENATDIEGYNVPVAATTQFVNSTGTELPETGGIGTTLFITFGALVMLGAGIFFVTNQRMRKEGF